MFLIAAAARSPITPDDAARLRGALGGGQPPRAWLSETGAVCAVGSATGILPEDAFDHQPYVSEDLIFTAQARLHNRGDVIAALAIDAARGAEMADSALLWHAYRAWGEGCVARITGSFAFAAWHRAEARMVAATDHIGTTELFYAAGANAIAISPRLGAVLAAPGVSHAPDLRALGLLIAPKIEPGSTPYRDIRSLVGGHLLVWQAGAFTITRWWQPDTTPRIIYRDPRDYARHAGELFARAVGQCLRSVTPIAATVSGGLDSTLIAAVAARQLATRGMDLAGYTSVPEPGMAAENLPGWDHDDWPFASALARRWPNLSLTPVPPGGKSPLSVLPAIYAASHQPLRNGANAVWMGDMLAHARDGGRRVLLTGQHGNPTISTSTQYAVADLWARGCWAQALRLGAAQLRWQAPSGPRAVLRALIGPGAVAALRRAVPLPVHRRQGEALLTAEFRARHADALDPMPMPMPGADRNALVRAAIRPIKAWQMDTLAGWSVEMRDPTADRTLIEALAGFPLEAHAIGGRTRGLARAMGEGLVPDAIRLRRHLGAQAPEVAARIAADAAAYQAATARVLACPRCAGIIDGAALSVLTDKLCRGEGDMFDAMMLDRALGAGLFLAGAA